MSDKILNPTPWVINTVHPGSFEAVSAAIEAATQKGIDGKPSEENRLLAIGQKAAKDALALIPEFYPGCNAAVVRADGRFTGNGIQIVINIDRSKTL